MMYLKKFAMTFESVGWLCVKIKKKKRERDSEAAIKRQNHESKSCI